MLRRRKTLRVAGLMSGTSVDGVDVAVVDIRDAKVRLVAFEVFPYRPALRAEVLALCHPDSAKVDRICHLNHVLGEVFAEAVLRLCRKCGIAADSIDLIGSHGQTIWHQPWGGRYGGRTIRSTLQIGEPSVIAHRTGITTVADFRPRDMAAGGQGAPLVPYADYVLFRDAKVSRAVQNIGGIANVTFLPAACGRDDILAFDTGPGNMVIDAIVRRATGGKRHFDRGGAMAARGKVDEMLLREMLKHPFLRRKPPKSTGREEFGQAYCEWLNRRLRKKPLPLEDMVATVTAFTARTIADAYRRFLPAMPDEMVLAGGGAHNRTLVRMLQGELTAVKIRTTDEFGIDVDAREAVAFAILAWATIRGAANNVPSATGASEPVVLGKIVPGR
ncbi:MAG TPA: anhydro-N-acetylmuramic acid kinase [Sedimentisphaerales bacterium]|nr:anhydro-N-acetylmuramic acid kinase [Sedimentisphaerales bacterium]HRS10050.1 anhydro-N-acetylmuramic acid kinase [Sedimentisphaerales bacterium]HRV46756.1 anhydro-N-acetylmuramic acid kinase [Sedimentisphaerales bacterium]